MKMIRRFACQGILALLVVAPVPAMNIDWSTTDGGGVLSSAGGTAVLSGTVGQFDAGPRMTGGTFELAGGFWPGAARGPIPGDCDSNGVVQLDDFACFTVCFTGLDGVYTSECSMFDLDFDGDVDADDYAGFWLQFGN